MALHLRIPRPSVHRATRRAEQPERRLAVVPPPADPAPPIDVAAPEGDRVRARERAACASQDEALNACSCGYAFTAPVTASVACPHCGAGQAW